MWLMIEFFGFFKHFPLQRLPRVQLVVVLLVVLIDTPKKYTAH